MTESPGTARVNARRFRRYELRTTDVAAARRFYEDVVGPRVWDAELRVMPLPERAAARGAPPHWLGVIGTARVAETAAAIAAAGGQQLGPPQPGPDGEPTVVLRDPFGAIVGLGAEAPVGAPDPVAWHLLAVRDVDRAFGLYATLFDWEPTGMTDLGAERGRHQMFRWDASGPDAGSVSDAARHPHVHPQWQYFLRVPDLDAALAAVAAGGGTVTARMRTARGDAVAPCEDPQGAAFGLMERAAPPAHHEVRVRR